MFVIKHKERDCRNEIIWGYISNVSQVAVKEIDKEVYLKMYEDLPQCLGSNDPCEYLDGEKLPKHVAELNKIFSIVTGEMLEELGTTHCENLVFDYDGICNMPIYAVLLYIEDSKEFENILLITDQETYLMNDKGQTIERLV